MALKDYLDEVPFPEKVIIYESEKPIKIGLLNQYRESLRLTAITYGVDHGISGDEFEALRNEYEALIEQMIREKYKELYGLSWDIIGNTSAQEMIDVEDNAENEENEEGGTQEELKGIGIKNDGRKIIDTNFWTSEYAENGICYMSINAGCYRLLVPHYRQDWIKEMQAAQSVVISRGPHLSAMPPKSDAFEIMFADNTQSPFIIYTGTEQWDRTPTDADQGWKGVCHVYFDGSQKPVIEFQNVYYRRVKKIPWMKKVTT
jgi:hypothetical protein